MQPQHLKTPWLSILARLQSVAVEQRGNAVLTIRVVVDEKGLPIFWSEPKMTRLEPMSRTREWLNKLVELISLD